MYLKLVEVIKGSETRLRFELLAEMTDTATGSGQPHYPHYPYHGKVAAGKSLSALARDVLGWSADIWDFSNDLPVLK